jgi:WD40 repeat protein
LKFSQIKLHRKQEQTRAPDSGDHGDKTVSIVLIPEFLRQERSLSVTAILLLDTRPNLVNVGTFLTALSNGMILVWSHHTIGNYIGEFNAIHKADDQILVMSTDKENKYLFTGSAFGYIKTWLLSNAWNPDKEGGSKVVLPALRLKFSFLWKDLLDGRAKRAVRRQDTPMLLNSYKGHTKQVMDLTYIDSTEVLISTSRDKSARMWTLSGRYIGTLGSSVGWPKFQSSNRLSSDYSFRLPPDIHRECSFTTLKVLNGGKVEPLFERPVGKEVEGMLEGSGTSLKMLEDYKSLLTAPVQLHVPVARPVLDTKYTYVKKS